MSWRILCLWPQALWYYPQVHRSSENPTPPVKCKSRTLSAVFPSQHWKKSKVRVTVCAGFRFAGQSSLVNSTGWWQSSIRRGRVCSKSLLKGFCVQISLGDQRIVDSPLRYPVSPCLNHAGSLLMTMEAEILHKKKDILLVNWWMNCRILRIIESLESGMVTVNCWEQGKVMYSGNRVQWCTWGVTAQW